jgi:hypothetical protein
VKSILNFPMVNVVTTTDYNLFLPPNQMDEPILVDDTEVAGQEEPVGVERVGCLPGLPVA